MESPLPRKGAFVFKRLSPTSLTDVSFNFTRNGPLSRRRARYLALGDSYTAGEGLSPGESWPVQLVARLRQHGIPFSDPHVVARTSWTTDELLVGIAAARPRGAFGLVTLQIGVNNQYRGRDAEEYRIQLRDLLETAAGYALGKVDRVLVLSIPDWGATPFARDRDRGRIAREIDRFNEVNRREAGRLGARYVDVTRSSRKAAGDATLVAPDGLHPSARLHAVWADLALRPALQALGSPEA